MAKKTKPKDVLSPAVRAYANEVANKNWKYTRGEPGEKPLVQKTDTRRFLLLERFFNGVKDSTKPDAKGNPELATDGTKLVVCGEYPLARKTDIEVDGKKVLLYNLKHWMYFDPLGGSKQSGTHENVRLWVCDLAKLFGYVPVPGTAENLTGVFTLQCLVDRRIEDAMCLRQNKKYWSPDSGTSQEAMYWAGDYVATVKRALTAAPLLGMQTKFTSPFASLANFEGIKCSPWHKIGGVIQYWLAHGCEYSKEDEAYILTKKPSVCTRLAYQLTGGRSMVCQEFRSLVHLWIKEPSRPLEELVPYLRYEPGDREVWGANGKKTVVNDVEDLVKARLAGKKVA